MWHVSIASQYYLPNHVYEQQAKDILDGIGDASLGEWAEKTKLAFHLKRRLSTKEQERIGPAIDIRGTDEEVTRKNAIKSFFPF